MGLSRLGLLLWIPLVALCTYAGIWWQVEGTRWKPPSPSRAKVTPGEFARVQWNRRMPGAQSIYLDPAGEHLAIVGPGGLIRVLDAAGNTRCERAVRAVDSVVLTTAGNRVAAFQRASESDTRLSFFRLDGSDSWEYQVRQPIVDVSLSADGNAAVCVTTGGTVHWFDLEGRRGRDWWRSVGTPRQVYLIPDGSAVIVATEDPPGVWAYAKDGRPLWKLPNPDALGVGRIYPSPDGHFLACAVEPKPPADGSRQEKDGEHQSRFVVVSATGRQQWGARLRAPLPQVAISADGSFAAASYARAIPSREKPLQERKLVLFETAGLASNTPQQLWQHGGPFYDPRLVAIAADGAYVVARDGDRSIYFFDTTGQELWRQKAPAPILATQASSDGRTLLVYCHNGALTLLRVGDGGKPGGAAQ